MEDILHLQSFRRYGTYTHLITVEFVYFLQEIKDIYLFAIVGVLVLVDIVILIPPTAVSNAILRREQEEIEGDNVCFGINKMCLVNDIIL